MSETEEDLYLEQLQKANKQNNQLLSLIEKQNLLLAQQSKMLESMLSLSANRREIGKWILWTLFLNLSIAIMSIFFRDTLIYFISVGVLGVFVFVMIGRTRWLHRKEKKERDQYIKSKEDEKSNPRTDDKNPA